MAEGDEECDIDDLRGLECTDLHFDHGELACNNDCTLNIDGCAVDSGECDDGTHTCDPNAVCIPTYPGYRCECLPGFVGDGFVCVPGVETTFDEGLEDWTISDDSDYAWVSDGMGGGYLSVNDQAVGLHNRAVAPPKFLGDWGAFGPDVTLSFDVYLENTYNDPDSCGSFLVYFGGPGGGATLPPVCTPEGVWTTHTVSLDPAAWTVESGDFAGAMNLVSTLLINAEFVLGEEQVYIDNVRLAGGIPASAAEQCAVASFGGLEDVGWSFSGTGGLEVRDSGGNPGAYYRVSDDPNQEAFAEAPPRFKADLSAMDGSGSISVDLRVVNQSGNNQGAPEFIRLSGPGGSAHVSLAPGDLPPPGSTWKTFTFPLDQAAWTVDQGTWEGLLANVTSLRVDLEYFDGDEEIGFDNFTRRAGDCPPPAVFDLIDVDLSHCGRYQLTQAFAVAFNESNGELYGLSRQEPGSGGGLYAITGPQAGTLLQSYDRPGHVIFDGTGAAIVSEDYAGIIYRLPEPGMNQEWVTGFHAGDDDPIGMTIAPDGFDGPQVSSGDILVTDRGNNGPDEIYAFSADTPEGERLLVPDPGETDIVDLAAGVNAQVWACDQLDSNHLFTVDAQGNLTALDLSVPVDAPVSVVHDPESNQLYVASGTNGGIYRVDPDNGQVSLVAVGFSNLSLGCLEIAPQRRKLWVVDHGCSGIFEICLP